VLYFPNSETTPTAFDVADARSVTEVGVDAKTGVVLENHPEGKNSD